MLANHRTLCRQHPHAASRWQDFNIPRAIPSPRGAHAIRLPMDTFRAIGNAVRVRDPQTGIPVDHLVGQLIQLFPSPFPATVTMSIRDCGTGDKKARHLLACHFS